MDIKSSNSKCIRLEITQTILSTRKRTYLTALAGLIRLPNLIMLAVTQIFTAVFLIGPKNDWLVFVLDKGLWALIISTSLVAGAGYVINDYHDVKIDAVNKPKKLFVGRLIPRRYVLLLYFTLNILGLALALFVGKQIALINLTSISLLWVYSAKLKKTFLLGNVVVALLTLLSVYLVALYFDRNYFLVGLFGLFAFFTNFIREVIKDIEDMKGDAAFGCRTLPVVLGVRKSKQFIYLIIIAFVFFLYWSVDQVQSTTIIALAFFLSIILALFTYTLYKADTKKSFSELSFATKMIMLGGILSMLLV